MGWRAGRDTAVERRVKVAARSAARVHRRLQPDRCELCGAEQQLQKHHPDYSQPLEVQWLCVPCHVEQHRSWRVVRGIEGIRTLLNTLRR